MYGHCFVVLHSLPAQSVLSFFSQFPTPKENLLQWSPEEPAQLRGHHKSHVSILMMSACLFLATKSHDSIVIFMSISSNTTFYLLINIFNFFNVSLELTPWPISGGCARITQTGEESRKINNYCNSMQCMY